MPRIPWPKVAKALEEKYVEGTKCKICNAELEGENRVRTLLNIYRHFKEEHPDELEKVKQELAK